MNKNIYVGIDPDLRLLNAAIVTQDQQLLAVFLRRNKGGRDDEAVANAARMACRLIEDVIAYFVAHSPLDGEIVLVIESQNMQYTGRTNSATKAAMVQLCQVTGCLMGAFSNMCERIHLVQPIHWKGNTPKQIHHARIYGGLNLQHEVKSGYGHPTSYGVFTQWSEDKINFGDFKDISDSIGLALYGAKKGL